VTARLAVSQPTSTPPSKFLNDGNSHHSFNGVGISFANLDERLPPIISAEARIAARQQPPAREALRREVVDFPSSPSSSSLPSEIEKAPSKTKGRAPTTAEKWWLKHFIADLLRPTVDDPQTGKRKHGPAVCGCGWAANSSSEVTLHLRNRPSGPRAGVSGIYRCDSIWLCPVCAPAAAFERQRRVRLVVDATVEKGGTFAAVVLTVGHDKSHPLSDLKDAVLAASSNARAGKSWLKIRSRMKAIGVLVAPEVTYSKKHGWHFHLHLGLLCLTQDRAAIEAACREMIARYIGLLQAAGYRADWQAQHISFPQDSISAAEYMGKGGAVWEIAGGTGTKTSARESSLTPFEIAAAAAAGDPQMKKLFLEYARVMPATRSCIITAAMRLQLGLGKETDQPGPHDLDEKDNIVGTFPSTDWNILARNNIAGRLLGRLELEGSAAWPQIKAWALAETTSATKKILDQIPFVGPTTTLIPPPPPDPALYIADRSRRFFGGRKIIEDDLARLTREHEHFCGKPPPSISAIAAALVKCPDRHLSRQ